MRFVRYRYGMFKQDIHNGAQIETPDYWLNKGCPWEIQRTDVVYTIRFGGYVTMNVDNDGNLKV
jgi:starch phosphorylase